jgi:alpha-beta hydrolase superfamily lysophospholipase
MRDFDRRAVLCGTLAGGALLALSGCASVPNAPAVVSALTREVVRLPAASGAEREAIVWTPSGEPRGVALLSASSGRSPDHYAPLVDRLGGMGLAIIAPVYADSPGSGSPSQGGASQERIAGLAASAAIARDRFAGRPVLAVGHGLGSLTAIALSAALAQEGTFTEPTPRGVIAFSAPAGTERLAGPDTVATLGVPVLLLGGSNDPASAERLLPTGTGDADSYALVMAGGGPDLIDDAAFVERAWPVIDLFVQAYLFDIFTAGDVLEDWPATGEDRFIARRGSS